MTKKPTTQRMSGEAGYKSILGDVAGVIEAARRSAARSVNSIITAAYWLIGRRIVEHEQGGGARAAYGEELIEQLAKDLSARFGRGFGKSNLFDMRAFYLSYANILRTAPGRSALTSADEKFQTVSGKSETLTRIPDLFWTGSSRPRVSRSQVFPTGVGMDRWRHRLPRGGVD